MLRGLKLVLAGLTLGSGMFVGGCMSNSKPSPDAMAGTPSNDAVACDKCKVTFVKNPETNQKGRVIGYTEKKQMVCPECKSAAENMFATGKMEHTCKACGGNMTACAVH